MSFNLRLVLSCDNGCGDEEDYGEDAALAPHGDLELPDGWKRDYSTSDSIFEHICRACVEQFEEDE